MDEWIDIVDSNNRICGKTLKNKAHRLGLAHRSVHLWLHNNNFSKFIIQKRSSNKDSYPGLWDVSVAGHISSGEKPTEAVLREAAEEIGVKLKEEDLEFIGINHKQKIHGPKFIDHEFQYIYRCAFDKPLKNLKLQTSEVAQVAWIPLSTLAKNLKDKPQKFVQRSSDYIALIKLKLHS